MEWIDGVPLDRWADDTWSRLGARDATTAIVVCLEKVVSAVASAHARGIMHRDLKPSNVLILPTGEPKVLDFGLAKALTGATEVTRANGFAGTPAWAAPEQVTGDPRDIDARTDVHGLGLLLYRALAGRTAFDGTLPILPLFEAIKTATPAPPSRERKSVARELDCITLRALEKEPARRYQSAESLTRDLERVVHRAQIRAPTSRDDGTRRDHGSRSCWWHRSLRGTRSRRTRRTSRRRATRRRSRSRTRSCGADEWILPGIAGQLA
jgi:serine/threonine-protein kinase